MMRCNHPSERRAGSLSCSTPRLREGTMPIIPSGPALQSLPPDQIVYFLLGLCVVVVAATAWASARCRREECELDRKLRQVLRGR